MDAQKSKYNKQKLSIDEQLDVLRDRGLEIENIEEARNILLTTSYFRLAGYWGIMEFSERKSRCASDNLPYRNGQKPHKFRKGSCFSTAIDYYNFDKELRFLIFASIQDIEISLRTKIINHFGDNPFWFMDREYATEPDFFQSNLARIEKEILRSREEFIREHFRKYANPELPPLWKTLEVVSLGTMSRLFSNYKNSELKQKVAQEFGIKHYKILRNWLECLTIMRNCCTHQSRLLNRTFYLKPRLPQKMPNAWISDFSFEKVSLYPHLCLICYCQKSIDKSSTFVDNLRNLFRKYPCVDATLLGFPKNWDRELLWRSKYENG